MAKALLANYDLAKQLYMKGVTMPAIARQLGIKVGTLRTRKTREKWARMKEAANTTLEPVQIAEAETVGEQITNSVVAEADELIKSLVSMGRPRTLGDARTKAQALLTTLSAARKALQPETGSGGPRHLHLHVAFKSAKQPDEAPAIDVESESI